MEGRDFDVVLWGASGYTGQLVAEHLFEHYGAGGPLCWALAGRNQGKLEALRARLGGGAGAIPILVGDSGDSVSLRRIAERARVICSSVGPFAMYGSELVAACVSTGTHYCDITGEVHWVRRMIDAHGAEAQATGARLVSFCGVDSIPSDLGCSLLNERMRELHDGPCAEAKLFVERFSGGFSGGSYASIINTVSEAARDREARRTLSHPYGLNPVGDQSGPETGDQRGVRYDADVRAWTAPFVMEGVNARVVRRSNALLGYPYGRQFRYREAMLTGPGTRGLGKALAIAAATSGALLAAVPPVRSLAARVLPRPGEGITAEQRERGSFEMLLLGKRDGHVLRLRIDGDRDPGYGATSRMLGESAVCLARDDLHVSGGFWTPASALGKALVRRLEQRAGVRFTPV
jgi:short subunit dehydrogenase-like uncharacterized protein